MTDAAEQTADALEHALALDRVRLDHRPLLGSELPRLADDLRRDADLADVVEKGSQLGVALVLASRPSSAAVATTSSTTSRLCVPV